jgi:hypothetical protein
VALDAFREVDREVRTAELKTVVHRRRDLVAPLHPVRNALSFLVPLSAVRLAICGFLP